MKYLVHRWRFIQKPEDTRVHISTAICFHFVSFIRERQDGIGTISKMKRIWRICRRGWTLRKGWFENSFNCRFNFETFHEETIFRNYNKNLSVNENGKIIGETWKSSYTVYYNIGVFFFMNLPSVHSRLIMKTIVTATIVIKHFV